MCNLKACFFLGNLYNSLYNKGDNPLSNFANTFHSCHWSSILADCNFLHKNVQAENLLVIFDYSLSLKAKCICDTLQGDGERMGIWVRGTLEPVKLWGSLSQAVEEPQGKDHPCRGVLHPRGRAWLTDPHHDHHWTGSNPKRLRSQSEREVDAKMQYLRLSTVTLFASSSLKGRWEQGTSTAITFHPWCCTQNHIHTISGNLSYIISMGHFFWR